MPAPRSQIEIFDYTADTTITVGASGFDYTTVSAAYDSLAGKTIKDGVTVTIEIQDEAITETAGINFDHPDGDKILIAGKTAAATTIISYQSISGTPGAYSLVLNVTDESIFSVGGFAFVYGASGSADDGYLTVNGVWKVTNVDATNSRITITYTSRDSSGTANLNGGTIYALDSVIACAASGTIVQANGAACHLRLKNLVVEDTGSADYCISAIHLGLIDFDGFVGASGGQYGIAMLYGGRINGRNYNWAACNATYQGLYMTEQGWAYLNSGIVNGNGGYGADITGNSMLHASGLIAAGNTSYGIQIASNSAAYLNSCKCVNNGSVGLYLRYNARVHAESAYCCSNANHGCAGNWGCKAILLNGTFQNNASWGLYFQDGCTVNANSANIASNTSGASNVNVHTLINLSGASITGTLSPVANTEGNEVSYNNT